MNDIDKEAAQIATTITEKLHENSRSISSLSLMMSTTLVLVVCAFGLVCMATVALAMVDSMPLAVLAIISAFVVTILALTYMCRYILECVFTILAGFGINDDTAIAILRSLAWKAGTGMLLSIFFKRK